MIEVFKHLFVGDDNDYQINKAPMNQSWFVVHACKEPYHRDALGYQTRGAPKDSRSYYYLYDRYNHLILNIVDGVPAEYYNDNMIDEAILYCLKGLKNGSNVLIHCNQGESRAPTIAMLVLKKLNVLSSDFQEAFNSFKEMYINFNPSQGILKYLQSRWQQNK